MYCEFPAINLNDWFSLVSVWEQSNQGWRRVCTVRKAQARILCKQSNRLIFPTNIDLNGKNKFIKDSLKICKFTVTKERILEIIERSPGQTTVALAKQLDLSVPTLRQHLKLLQDTNLIYYHPDSCNKRIKRFYAGEKLKSAESDNNFDVVQAKPELPEVRVYFVNFRLLQR